MRNRSNSIISTESSSREFEGLILNLYKRRLDVSTDDSDFILFGFYDYLSIQHTDTWFGFSPIETGQVGKGGVDIHDMAQSDPFSDRYPIKLLFPHSQCQKNMERSGFSFTPWRKGSKWGIDQKKSEYPLITIVQFNITNKLVSCYQTPGRCFEEVANGITKVARDVAGFKKTDALISIDLKG